jgi:glycosyltransferase involved in cell wall biosynthesis
MIDIIIPTYNRSALLDLTLSSLLNQTINLTSINVVVVDDGSSDNTSEVVKSYSDKLNLKYFYQADRGYRVASARNMGLKNCNSDICVFIDAGIILESNCISKHFEFHNNFDNPISAIGYVYGFDDRDPDLKELVTITNKIKDTDSLITYFDAKRIFLDAREREYNKYNYKIDQLPAPWVYFWSGHLSINRKYMESEIYFDTVFEPRYGFEDIDLGYRLHHKKMNIYLLKEAKAFHYPHGKMGSYCEDNEINSHIFYLKHKTELVRLFNNNGGTFGFNELLLKMNIS